MIQWIVLAVCIFCTLKYQNSTTVLEDTIATLGGGIAMMIIIQAILFFFLGGFISKNMSSVKIFFLVVVALTIIKLVYNYLTSGLKR